MKSDKKRVFYFDLLRMIACFCVVMLHVVAYLVTTKSIHSADFWIGNIFSSITRVGVPIFVMISGTLFLNEAYNCTFKKMAKHIIRLLVFYIVWSLIYALTFQVIIPAINKVQIDGLLFWLTFRDSYYHLWFIPMIIGLYLITPLLRLWVKKENIKYVHYFLLLCLIFAFVIPQSVNIVSWFWPQAASDVSVILNKIKVYYVLGMISYYVLGWYLSEFDIKNKLVVYIAGGLCFLITIFGTIGASYYKETPATLFYETETINVLGSSIMIFVLVKTCVKEKENESIGRKIISLITGVSLGIYAVHAAILQILHTNLDGYIVNWNAFAYIGAFFSIIAVSSFVISIAFKWIPFINKIFN